MGPGGAAPKAGDAAVTVGIVTDSAAALSSEVAEATGVVVVPMRITIGDTSYSESDVTLEEVVAGAGAGLATAGPSPAEMSAAVERVSGSDGVLVLTVARRLSGSFEAARMGVSGISGRVRVLDTGTAAGAQGLVVLAAAARASSGGSLEEVEDTAARVSDRVRLVATLGDLDWLARGGHVPGVAAWAGRSLGLRPLIELRSGRVRPLRPARSDGAAIDRMVELCLTSRASAARLHVVAMHALAPGRAERLLEAVRGSAEPATAVMGPFSPVMIAHTGPDLYGLAWWWEDQAQ
jgi:DegV family protein with EDD domain